MNGTFGGEGEAGQPAGRDFQSHVGAQIDSLDVHDLLTIIELAVDGVVVWEVLVDPAGTPQVKPQRLPWAAFTGRDGELAGELLKRYTEPQRNSRVMLARTRAEGGVPDRAAALLAAEYRVQPYALWSGDSVKRALGSAVAVMPLRQRYSILAVRQTPEGTLRRTTRKLFGAGTAAGGPPREFRVWVERAGDHGTTFAVLASDESTDRPQYRLVSLQSAAIRSGSYTLRATLRRAGEVRFDLDGEPVRLRSEARTLDEITAAVPERLDQFAPAHLIIAVELSGPGPVFARRIGRARQLVEAVEREAEVPVAYSVLGYGAHQYSTYQYAIDQTGPDQEVQVLAWASEAVVALHGLSSLAAEGPVTEEATASAKVECVLPGIAQRLARQRLETDRPVLVTIGSAGPHPPLENARERGLPCPRRNDWRAGWVGLRDAHPATGFGLIHDGDPGVAAWRQLGRDAHGHLNAVDIRQFGVDLGLIRHGGVYVPFPLIRNGGR